MLKKVLALMCLASVANAQTYKFYEKTTAPAGGYVVNIKDFGTSVGTGSDDTTAFSGAVTKALASTGPATIYLPCGNYIISSAIAITLTVSTTHGVYIKGENVGCVKVTQSGDADGFDFTINNFGPSLFSSGSAGVSGITLAMTGASTAKVGISITTSASSGAQGTPVVIDQVNFTSVDATHYWGTELSLNEVTGFYISRVNGTYPAAAVGTHLLIQGNATSYSAAGSLRDLYFINGTGLNLSDYLQGIVAERLNIHAVAAGYAIYSSPAAGSNLAIQISDSYLLGRVYLNATGSATLASFKFSNNYFDALGTVIPANDFLVNLNSVNRLSLNNNTYSCTGGSSGITALSLVGTFITSTINDEQMIDCPVGIAINATTYPVKFSHVQFRPNSAAYVNVVDTSSAVTNVFGADVSMGNNLGVEQYQFPAWTTSGIIMGGTASTITDTTTTGTIAEEVMAALPQETLTLSTGHTATVTVAATLYVPPPLCSNAGGGTLTCTNLLSVDAPGIIRSTVGGVQSTAGATLQGGGVSLNASSNNNTLINTGNSTGTTTIGNSLSAAAFNALTNVFANAITPSTTAGIVGTAAADQPTAGSIGEVASIQCNVLGPAAAATTVTMTIATPAVVTWSSHTFAPSTSLANYTCPINFTTTGALPTGVVAGTNCYIIGSTVSGDTFQISDTAAHALAATNAVATSGTQSGTQAAYIGALTATSVASAGAALKLVAGDWDCSGLAEYQELTSITATRWTASVDTSIALTIGNYQDIRTAASASGAANYMLATPIIRQNLSATTSVFLVTDAAFSAGTMNQGGFLRCRRMR